MVTDPSGTPPRVVSANSIGVPATSVGATDLSGNGRYVSFQSTDPTLVGDDTNRVGDVFTRSVAQQYIAP